MSIFNILKRASKSKETDLVDEKDVGGKQYATPIEVIHIDTSEYDETDIASVLQYALLKYGNEVIADSKRLNNILSDLAPKLVGDIKLLICLAQANFLKPIINLDKVNEADLRLWHGKAIDYLTTKEYIDEKVAYVFCRKLIAEYVFLEDYSNELEEVAEKKAEDESEESEIQRLRRQLEKSEQARVKAEALLKKEKQLRKTDLGKFQIGQQNKTGGNAIDYNERTNILELFQKYNGNINGNVIIVDIGWTGDYCFVVDEIVRKNGLKARGKLYKDGEFYRNFSFPADTGLYRMYDGPSESEINAIHTKRDNDKEAKVVELSAYEKPKTSGKLIMPNGSDEYTSIEKICMANPGKRVIVVRDNWHGDYCFAVESFEGVVKAIGTRFSNGVPVKEDWMDRRHRKYKVYNGPSKKKIERYYQ